MNLNDVEYIFKNFLQDKYPDANEKKKSNIKYRIKKGWDTPTCKISNEFKKYVEDKKNDIDNDLDKLSEKVKINEMTDEERDAYILAKHKASIKNYEANITKLKNKFSKQLKKNNIKDQDVFKTYFKHDGEWVKAIDEGYLEGDNNALLDGRLTYPLEVMRIEDEKFDESFNNMTNFLNKEFELNLDLEFNEWFKAIAEPYYDLLRSEFEKKLILDNRETREKEKALMPKREPGESYLHWVKKMREAGFYCGYPHEDWRGPISDLNAWVFVGKMYMRCLHRQKKEWEQEYIDEKDYNYPNIDFMELQFNTDQLTESSKHIKIHFAGYNCHNITVPNVNTMKKRFETNFINRKLHTMLKYYGKE